MGIEFTIMVQGRAVAHLGPLARSLERRLEVDASTVARLLADTAVDPGFAQDMDTLRGFEAPVQDPWPDA